LIISHIVAMDMDNGIARDGGLPWHLSADLAKFKQLTMGHFLLMGRKTYDAIGKPLPGRKTIIVTRDPSFHGSGFYVAHTLSDAIETARLHGESELFIAGGGEIFVQTLDLADRIYLTYVFTRAGCDVFFPSIDGRDWKTVESWFQPQDLKNEFAFEFRYLERQPPDLS